MFVVTHHSGQERCPCEISGRALVVHWDTEPQNMVVIVNTRVQTISHVICVAERRTKRVEVIVEVASSLPGGSFSAHLQHLNY